MQTSGGPGVNDQLKRFIYAKVNNGEEEACPIYFSLVFFYDNKCLAS